MELNNRTYTFDVKGKSDTTSQTFILTSQEVERSEYLTRYIDSKLVKRDNLTNNIKLDCDLDTFLQLLQLLGDELTVCDAPDIADEFVVDLWMRDEKELERIENSKKIFTIDSKFIKRRGIQYSSSKVDEKKSGVQKESKVKNSIWKLKVYPVMEVFSASEVRPLIPFTKKLWFGGSTIKNYLAKVSSNTDKNPDDEDALNVYTPTFDKHLELEVFVDRDEYTKNPNIFREIIENYHAFIDTKYQRYLPGGCSIDLYSDKIIYNFSHPPQTNTGVNYIIERVRIKIIIHFVLKDVKDLLFDYRSCGDGNTLGANLLYRRGKNKKYLVTPKTAKKILTCEVGRGVYNDKPFSNASYNDYSTRYSATHYGREFGLEEYFTIDEVYPNTIVKISSKNCEDILTILRDPKKFVDTYKLKTCHKESLGKITFNLPNFFS